MNKKTEKYVEIETGEILKVACTRSSQLNVGETVQVIWNSSTVLLRRVVRIATKKEFIEGNQL